MIGLNAMDKRAMEQDHLAKFKQVRERLLAQWAQWKAVEQPNEAATHILVRLDRGLTINALLIDFAEQQLASLVLADVE